MASNGAELALYRQLQKVFKTTKQQLDLCEQELNNSQGAVDALLNVCEQFSLAGKVNIKNTPFAEEFPDVQQRLLSKLEHAISNRLSTLQSVVDTFQEAHTKITKLSSQTFSLYEKYSDQLSILDVTTTKATIPSISSMLKWTKDLDFKFHEEFVIRAHMVKAFNPEEVVSFQEDWTNIRALRELVINTSYSQVQFLLSEKF